MQNKITKELNSATEYLRAMIKTGAHKEDCENVMMHLANIDDIINEPVNGINTEKEALHIDSVMPCYFIIRATFRNEEREYEFPTQEIFDKALIDMTNDAEFTNIIKLTGNKV